MTASISQWFTGVRSRILFLAAGPALGILALAVAASVAMRDADRAVTSVVERAMPELRAGGALDGSVWRVLAALQTALSESDLDARAALLDRAAAAESRMTGLVAELGTLLADAEDDHDIPAIREGVEALVEATGGIRIALAEGSMLADERALEAYQAAVPSFLAETQPRIDALAEASLAFGESAGAAAGAGMSRAATVLMAGAAIATVVGTLVGLLVATRLIGRIEMLRRGVRTIRESGAYRTRVEVRGRDELADLAQAFNAMLDEIVRMLDDSANAAGAIVTSTETLHGDSAELAREAQLAHERARSVAAAAEQMSASLASMSDAAGDARGRVHEVRGTIGELAQGVERVKGRAERSIERVAHAGDLVRRSTERVDALGNAAERIGRVVALIGDVAEQTNLLALNATIEAARAGDAGRGFAVVANEVKNLASETSGATGEIRESVRAIQTVTTEAIEAMRSIREAMGEIQGVAREIADDASTQASGAGAIVQAIEITTEAIEVVATGIEQSAQASREISTRTAEVDAGATRTAAAADRVADAGRSLEALAEKLTA